MKDGQEPAQKHIDKLLSWVEEGKVRLDDIITHRSPDIAHAHDIFKYKKEDCVKVVLDPWN